MPLIKTNETSAGYAYSRSSETILWRQSDPSGMIAIPYDELAQRPRAVLDYMQRKRWPLAVEHGWEPIALARPFGSETIELLGARIVKQVTAEQIGCASARDLKESLGRGALVLALGQDIEPSIIITQYLQVQDDETVPMLSEVYSRDNAAMTATRFMHDPESGQAFTVHRPADIEGSNLAQDMQFARQHRL